MVVGRLPLLLLDLRLDEDDGARACDEDLLTA